MKIIACVHGAGEELTALVAALHRQIRPPEEVLVSLPNTSSGSEVSQYSKVTRVESTEDDPLVSILSLAIERLHQLTPAERYDAAFLLLSSRVELRKDAVDYLRRTYVPGRIVAYQTENPYSIGGLTVSRLDASGVVLVPCRVVEKLSQDWEEMSRKLRELPGYKGIGLGWWCARRQIPSGIVGSAVRYARSLDAFTMDDVERAGDHITNFWCAE